MLGGERFRQRKSKSATNLDRILGPSVLCRQEAVLPQLRLPALDTLCFRIRILPLGFLALTSLQFGLQRRLRAVTGLLFPI